MKRARAATSSHPLHSLLWQLLPWSSIKAKLVGQAACQQLEASHFMLGGLVCTAFPSHRRFSSVLLQPSYWRGCRALNRKGKRCLKIKFNYRGRGWQGFKVLRGAGGKGHRILFPSCRSNCLNGFRLHIITSSLSGPAVLILLHSCGSSVLL